MERYAEFVGRYAEFAHAKIRQYAEACADAYVSNFVGAAEGKVMGDPVVIRDDANPESPVFSWQSSLTPLSATQKKIETIIPRAYGEVGEDPVLAREAIINYLEAYIDENRCAEMIIHGDPVPPED